MRLNYLWAMLRFGREPGIVESLQGIGVGNVRGWVEQPLACYCLYHATTAEPAVSLTPLPARRLQCRLIVLNY